jgi:hypothetical protein
METLVKAVLLVALVVALFALDVWLTMVAWNGSVAIIFEWTKLNWSTAFYLNVLL